MPSNFRPNFARECYICSRSPTVIVEDHVVPETDLCGPHFFNDSVMTDWELWNEEKESTE